MAAQAMVPIELFEAVIDQASDHPTSLHRLALTCQAFLPRARHHLFSDIVIRSVQRLDAFCKFLESRLWAPTLVRRITISMALRYDPCTPTICLLNVAPTDLLSRLPSLGSWKMEVTEDDCGPKGQPVLLSPHRSVLSCYERYGGRIQDLELSNISFDNISDFQALVLAFTGICSLSCSHIRFRTTTEGAAEPNTAITQPPRLKRLRVGPVVDICAVEYLLDSSLDTLGNLVLTVSSRPRSGDFSERLGKSVSRLSQLVSLTLVIACGRLPSEDDNADATISQDVRCATQILRCVSRDRLRDVRIEFEVYRIASLGRCFSWGGAPLDACSALEDTLLAFPLCRIVLRHAAVSRGRRRAEFWFPFIKRAFPKLDERGLLTFTRPQSDDPDPPSHEGRVTCLVASHDSKSIVTASVDGTIIVWDAARGTIAQEWLAHQGSVTSLALSPDSLRLVSAGSVGHDTFAVWNIANGDVCRAATPEGHMQPVATCAWSPDGTLIASASTDGTVRVWDALTFQQLDQFQAGDPRSVSRPRLLQFSPDSRDLGWISSSPTDGHTCSVWRPFSREQPRMLPSSPSRIPKGHVTIYALSFDPASRRIATAHGYSHGPSRELDGVRIWDLGTGAALTVLAGHEGPVVDVSFSPDGVALLSVSSDSSIKVWNVVRGQEMSLFREGPGRRTISKACFSPDGKYIATASWGKAVRVWKAEDASCAAVFDEHRESVRHVALSPNGEFLASGDDEGIIHIRRVSRFIGH